MGNSEVCEHENAIVHIVGHCGSCNEIFDAKDILLQQLTASRSREATLLEQIVKKNAEIAELKAGSECQHRSDDGQLAECPFCSSLDIGGSMGMVYCYKCDATIKKEAPLQNAINAWNTRKGKLLTPPITKPTEQAEGEPTPPRGEK